MAHQGRPMETLRLAFLGDVMLGRGVAAAIGHFGPDWPWDDTPDRLRRSDLVLGNLECAITTETRPEDPNKAFHFRAPPMAADALARAGVDFVSLANNHILDFGPQGLRETQQELDRVGVKWAGAGNTVEEATAPARLEAKGWRVSVIAAADHPRAWDVRTRSPGTHWTGGNLAAPSWHELEERIRAERARCDLLVLSLHWGPNMRAEPSDEFVAFARAAVEAGVDVLHGHSAHVFQPIGIWKGRVILYDCGEFVDDYRIDPHLRNDWANIFEVEVGRSGEILEVELVPCLINTLARRVHLAEGDERLGIRDRVLSWPPRFGALPQLQAGRLVIPVNVGGSNAGPSRPPFAETVGAP